jgi:hypothetical protein
MFTDHICLIFSLVIPESHDGREYALEDSKRVESAAKNTTRPSDYCGNGNTLDVFLQSHRSLHRIKVVQYDK